MKPLYRYLLCFLAGIVTTVLVSTLSFDCGKKNHYQETIVKYDTLTLERYSQRIDTIQNNIIKNIISKQVEPKIIYQEKISYKEIEKFKNYDLSLGFEKHGSQLRIFAVNINDSLIKEQVFENVYSNFTAWSANDGIIVKSNRFSFSGLKLYGEGYIPVQNLIKKDFYKEANYKLGLEAGLDYINKVELNLGVEKDFTTKDIQVKLKTSYRIY